jgi:RimJ/RimL family protein N-acetyltransferase
MKTNFFEGKLVELVPLDLEKDMALLDKWDRDSDYQRLLNISPATQFAASTIKDQFENDENSNALFMIKSKENDAHIGFVELEGFEWSARNAWVGIAIGEEEYRGKGYGTDAMNLLLKYAFHALNLHRVNLGVFEFNKRAIRSYEKCGFKYEGTERELIFKEDKRWNVHCMGVLRSEWETLQGLN